MAGRKLPRFLTSKQYAAHIGKSHDWVKGMCREDRIPDAQKLPMGWIIPEDAQLILRRLEMELPVELVLDVVPREQPEYNRQTPKPVQGKSGVELPGFERVAEGMSREYIYRKTGVHPTTQRRILEGKLVRPEVAVRLCVGLHLDIEELLRR